jgi:hypothetical protein
MDVKRYEHRMDTYQERSKITEDKIRGDCQLCELNITGAQNNHRDAALDLLDKYITLKNSPDSTTNARTRDINDAMRSLITQCETKLQDAGYLRERTGMSVKKPSHWKQEKPDGNDGTAFYSLLFDAVVVNMTFDIIYFNRTELNTVKKYVKEIGYGDKGTKTCENVAKTYAWIESNTDFEHPTRLNKYLTALTNAEQDQQETANTSTSESVDPQEETPTPPEQKNRETIDAYSNPHTEEASDEDDSQNADPNNERNKNNEGTQLTLDAL